MENKDSVNEKILSVAIKLFSEKGYEAVGVQEICALSEITKPTLYYYFGSKKGLLDKIIELKGEEFFFCCKEASFYCHDFINSLTKILKANIEFALKEKDFFHLFENLLHAPYGSESKNSFLNLEEKFYKLYEEFFINSVNEIGNMKGKEKLYSVLFFNNAISISENILNGVLELNDGILFQMVHSFVYGVVN